MKSGQVRAWLTHTCWLGVAQYVVLTMPPLLLLWKAYPARGILLSTISLNQQCKVYHGVSPISGLPLWDPTVSCIIENSKLSFSNEIPYTFAFRCTTDERFKLKQVNTSHGHLNIKIHWVKGIIFETSDHLFAEIKMFNKVLEDLLSYR